MKPKPQRNYRHSTVIFLCALAAITPGYPGGAPSSADSRQLGKVKFPISCSANSQASFNTAIALLHSFQYEEAEKTFGEIARRDPHCAMAYWGLAMALYQQLWNFPDAATLAKGHADIEKALAAGAPTGREREYIAATAEFYQPNSALSHTARAQTYSKALAKLYARYPSDVNSGAFYALSLVALAQDGVDDLANRRHAIAILTNLFDAHPDNPGVDHYLIHASDDPRLARLGLRAARNYARIAPDSAHALHMPSHIFTRLGYWQDSIQSNLASAGAARGATVSGRDDESGYQLHALTFLEYAYLQSGNNDRARRVIDEVMKVPGHNPHDLDEVQRLFEVTYDIENHDWKSSAALTLLAGDHFPTDTERIYWARTLGAARMGDVTGAREDFAKLRQAEDAATAKSRQEGNGSSSGSGVAEMEARAWLDFALGRSGQALRTMRAAAVREGPYGVDILGMPAEEMLGDLLMELRQPQEALDAYQTALAESPNRLDELYGAARAAELSGDATRAKSYFAELTKSCDPNSDRKECLEARAFVAKGQE